MMTTKQTVLGTLSQGACLRALQEVDFAPITNVVDEWWDGRSMRHLLPRLFFTHFNDTSFVVEQRNQLLAFLIGFRSQSQPHEAYIHFVGVHPGMRQRGYAKMLYQRFFASAATHGCSEIKCITSPVNTRSVAFHRALGFEIMLGDSEANGVSVHANYDGRGGDRVLFVKHLEGVDGRKECCR